VPGERGTLTIQNRVDLHCHTAASDGSLSPEALVARAGSQGLEVVGITDHDTTSGLDAALAAGRTHGVTVVPGVEISAVTESEEVHLLGYFIDRENPELRAMLTRTCDARRERAREMLARLTQLGLPLDWERLLEVAGEGTAIGRPHVAAMLLEAGHIESWEEAFERWIGRDCPAYVERYKLSPEEAIALVRRSGGLPVVAHPYIYSRQGERRHGLNLKSWLPRLCEAGLAGIEIYYPNYPREASRHLLSLAIKHRLAITGGSDFHGGNAGSALGSVYVPWAAWQGLLRRHEQATQRRTEQAGKQALAAD
jgi:3',5'-nucleoside bisphosphate phosphatase